MPGTGVSVSCLETTHVSTASNKMPLTTTSLASTDSQDNQDDKTKTEAWCKVGDKMGLKVRGWVKHYPGTITAINDEGTLNILMDDGSTEENVKSPVMCSSTEGGQHLITWATVVANNEAAAREVQRISEENQQREQKYNLQVEARDNMMIDVMIHQRQQDYEAAQKYLPIHLVLMVILCFTFVYLCILSFSNSDSARACDLLCEYNNVNTRGPLAVATTTIFFLSFFYVVYFVKTASKGCCGIHTLKHLRPYVGFGGEVTANIAWWMFALYIVISLVVSALLFPAQLSVKLNKNPDGGFDVYNIDPETMGNMTYCLNNGPCCARISWTVYSMIFPALVAIPFVSACLCGVGTYCVNDNFRPRGGNIGKVLWILVPLLMMAGEVYQIVLLYSR